MDVVTLISWHDFEAIQCGLDEGLKMFHGTVDLSSGDSTVCY